jgi:hypothetical protein
MTTNNSSSKRISILNENNNKLVSGKIYIKKLDNN